MKNKILSETNNEVDISLLSKEKLIKLKSDIASDANSYLKDLNRLSLKDYEADVINIMVNECRKDIIKIEKHLATLD